MSTKPFYRDTWAEIDLSAIKENVSNMKEHIGEHVHLMAVVKANAYGHGDAEVAKALLTQVLHAWPWPFWMKRSHCARRA